MSSQWILGSFAVGVLAIGFLSAVGLVFFLARKTPEISDPNHWYEKKYRELVSAFATGFTFFSILVGFLAMLPRYDYELIRDELEKLRQKNEQITSHALQVEAINQDLNRRLKSLEESVYKDYAETIRPAVAEKLKVSLPSVRTAEIYFPKIDTPKIDTPKIDTPKINTPEINTPEINTPEINTPEINTPKINTPEINTPKINTPEINTPKIGV